MFERKQTTRPGSVKVILGDDQKPKFNETGCKTGSISYRKRHLFFYLNTIKLIYSIINLQWGFVSTRPLYKSSWFWDKKACYITTLLLFKVFLKACKRLLDLDTLDGHLNIKSSNRDFINTNLYRTEGPTKSFLFNENVKDNNLINYDDFIESRFYSLTSLPSQKSVVSNFGQHDDHKFWQMTTNSSFDINYDRDEMKPLKHQWNKMLGQVSLSGVDVFSIQYDCIKGNDYTVINFWTNY